MPCQKEYFLWHGMCISKPRANLRANFFSHLAWKIIFGFLGFFSCNLKRGWYNVDIRVKGQENKENHMNIETDHIIRLLTSLFNEREKESVMSQNYAKITVDIQRIEKILSHRGVDVAEIFANLAGM